jgi:hypothetical protein
MTDLSENLTDLITGVHGSILIHVILLIPILITAQYLWTNRTTYTSDSQKRFSLGIGIALAVQGIILLINILFSSANPQAQLFAAVFERATTLSILVIFLWLWLPFKKQKRADILFGIMLALTFFAAILTLVSTNTDSTLTAFNATWHDAGWQFFSLLVAIGGFILINAKKPTHWKWMFLISGIQLSSFLLHMTLTNPVGYFSTIVRLAQIVAYSMIPATFMSASPDERDTNTEKSKPPVMPIISKVDNDEPQRTEPKIIPVMDYQILQQWTSILIEDRPEKVLASVCRALAHTLKADLCYILSGDPEQKELLLQGGYDLIREVDKIGGSIKKTRLPKINKALENEENLQLTIEEVETEDIRALRSLLSLDSETNLLLLPMGRLGHTHNAVLLLSPYSKRIWSKEEQNKVKPITEHINKLFQSLSKQTQLEFKFEQVSEQVSELEIANQDWQRQFEEINQEYLNETQVTEHLRLEIRNFEEKMSSMVDKSQYENIAARHQQNQGELERLQNNNEELKQQLEEMKSAFFDVENAGSGEQLPNFNGSSEVESMLAIQLESQEVISRLHQENTELQQELDKLSTSQKSIQHAVMEMPSETRSLYEAKKFEWLTNIQELNYTNSKQKIEALSEQLQQIMDQVADFSSKDDRKLRSQVNSWKNKADNARKFLAEISASESQITFPQLLDEIFENLNEFVMQKDLTLRVDIPDGMNDIPIYDDMVSHLLQTLLQDLVKSLQQENWLSIKIEKQFTNLIIHISLGCAESLQHRLLDILNQPQIHDEDIEHYFGLILAKDIIQNMKGMIESTENTTEQTNLFIRLPIN